MFGELFAYFIGGSFVRGKLISRTRGTSGLLAESTGPKKGKVFLAVQIVDRS